MTFACGDPSFCLQNPPLPAPTTPANRKFTFQSLATP
jgi:hypothetical protein